MLKISSARAVSRCFAFAIAPLALWAAAPSISAQSVTTKAESSALVAGNAKPAIVGGEADSFAKFLHFPKDPAVANIDGAAQFYCDVSATGSVETTYAVLGNQPLFNAAVRSALDWGRFTPASVNGKPVAAYVAGTVLFVRQNGQPVIIVSLATHDRARVSKLGNYIQPQLIGGLRGRLLRSQAGLPPGMVANGTAEVLINVSEEGKLVSVKTTAPTGKDTGLDALLEVTLKDAELTPAFADGKPTAGILNVVATFGDARFEAEREYMYAPPGQ